MKKFPPKIDSGITHDLIKDITLWFINNDKWTKEINTKSQFLLHNLIWPESTKSTIQKDIKNPENNPVLYLTRLIIKDVDKCGQNRDKFRDLIQKLFDLSGETLKRCSRITLKYNIDVKNFNIDRAMKKIGKAEEQTQFANSLYFDRMTSARLRILGWIYHELYGEWYKDFVKEEKESDKAELNEIKKFEAKVKDYKDDLFGASLFYEETKLTQFSFLLESIKFEESYKNIMRRGKSIINKAEKILNEVKINHNINKLKEIEFPLLEKDMILPDNIPRFKLLVETYNELFPKRDRKIPLTEKEHRLIMSKVIDKF